MDILIYTTPETIKHKFLSEVSRDTEFCFWTTGRIPSLDNLYDIKKVYFSDSKRIIAEGVFFSDPTKETKNLCFSPLRQVNKKQPKKPPTRGWCYINK